MPTFAAKTTPKAQSAAKAKFRFPSKDLVANIIQDNRSDEEKVNDIMGIWCQILTKEEQDIWNSIAECDLTNNITLSSGLRIPKHLIDAEIRAFKNVNSGKKRDLLSALKDAPDLHPSVPPETLQNVPPPLPCSYQTTLSQKCVIK